MRREFFPGIQALRGFAALLVVFQHSIFYACSTAGIAFEPYLKVGFGSWGVMLFFCISGFVIGLNRHVPAATFAARRALRIYPAFWLTCAIAVLVLPGAKLDAWAALLLPASAFNETLHIPYWTLIFEIAFYALASVVFAFRLSDRALSLAAAAWIVAVQLLGAYFNTEALAQAPGLLILISPYAQLFAVGFLICLHRDKLAAVDAHYLLGAAAIAGFVLATVRMDPAGYVLVYGILGGAIIVLAARAESSPPLLHSLGDASYGLFLIHRPVLVVTSAVFAGSWLAGRPFALWMTMTAIATIAGLLFGLAEFSIHRRITRR